MKVAPETILAIDVVVMPDGLLTSLDNRRLAAALVYGAEQIKVTVRAGDDRLTASQSERFGIKLENGDPFVPRTWAEAAAARIYDQNQRSRENFRETFRMGSPYIPRITNLPPTSPWQQLYNLSPVRRGK